ncbi:CHCH domain-containing protein [Colletotrichum higginsianum]|nr:CHCH domain-containing protein [Colletotrichum higginsianum]
MASRRPQFNQQVQVDTTPLPDDIPKVKEVGASSAPLLSASYFIGARCREYNDDFMQCKTENPGRGEFDCLKEGRRVTRCASSVYVEPFSFSVGYVGDQRWKLALNWDLADREPRGAGHGTNVAIGMLKDINTHCLEQFKAHWTCIENRNHQLYQCRPAEWKLNKCVYENLKLEKNIPNQRPGVTPVELRPHMIYADQAINTLEGKPFIPPSKAEGSKQAS